MLSYSSNEQYSTLTHVLRPPAITERRLKLFQIIVINKFELAFHVEFPVRSYGINFSYYPTYLCEDFHKIYHAQFYLHFDIQPQPLTIIE